MLSLYQVVLMLIIVLSELLIRKIILQIASPLELFDRLTPGGMCVMYVVRN